MEAVKIILLCVASAIAYGIFQDQITARVCVEYFTIGHPPIFGGIKDPTLLAFSWGVLATWWVGVLLGIPAAFLSRAGSRPKLGWRDLRIPISTLMFAVAVCAVIAGIGGYFTTARQRERLPLIEIQFQPRYVADAAAHGVAYTCGFVGGLLVCGWIWWRRGRDETRNLRMELERLRSENQKLTNQLSSR